MHVCSDCGSTSLKEFNISATWLIVWLLSFSTLSFIFFTETTIKDAFYRSDLWGLAFYFAPLFLSFTSLAHLIERKGHFRATHSCYACNSLNVVHVNTNAGREACIKHNVKIENKAA